MRCSRRSGVILSPIAIGVGFGASAPRAKGDLGGPRTGPPVIPSGLPPPPFPRWACGPRPGFAARCVRKSLAPMHSGRPGDRPAEKA